MADLRDLSGASYEEDFPVLKEYLEDIAQHTRMSDLEGQIITHTFTTTSAEEIPHKLGRDTVNWVILDKDVAATVHKTTSSTSTISLASSSSSLVLKFYVE